MKSIRVHAVINAPIEELWETFLDVKKYSSYAPFTHRIETDGKPQRVGSIWYDTTTILFIPFRLQHITSVLKKHEKIVYDIIIPFRGSMRQTYKFQSHGKKTKLELDVFFNIGRVPLKHKVMSVWARRARHMITKALTDMGGTIVSYEIVDQEKMSE